ncbi:DNA-binding transcriptional MerR regulator [Streptomyces sp. B1I3]|nr:DNA-binding transcriptional MerR regulator [Streptomyces sp. B1I3]
MPTTLNSDVSVRVKPHTSETNHVRMQEMVRRTGVNERLLRYYEQQGLLAPDRLSSGYRIHSDTDVETVRPIRCLLAAGLPTSLIAQVLPCITVDDDRIMPTCPDLVAQLQQEHERISRAIEELQASRAMLGTIITEAPPQNGEEAPRKLRARQRRSPTATATVNTAWPEAIRGGHHSPCARVQQAPTSVEPVRKR